MKSMKALPLIVAMLFVACASSHTAVNEEPHRPSERWGHFSGPVDARWDNDGLDMVLLTELRYTDPNGVVWVAPAGAKVNGASIPRAFWSIMGGPFEGKYRNASVLHDVAYDDKTRSAREADRMFYNAMRCSGVGVVEAKTMYYALYQYGRHWKHPIRRATAVQPSDMALPAERATSVDPAEVDAIENWISNNDPSLSEIEAHANASTH